MIHGEPSRQRRPGSRELARRLVRLTVMAAGVITLALCVAALGLHVFGKLRLNAIRSKVESRWGSLGRPEVPEIVPDHENGARWLAAGGQAIVCSTQDMGAISRLSGLSPKLWSARDVVQTRQILTEQRHALALLLRAGECDTFHLGTDGDIVRYHEIGFLGLVKGLRLLILEARFAWMEGRNADGLRALEAVSRSSDGLLRTPLVVGFTGGAAAQRWASRAALDFVEDPCTDPQTLELLRQLLPTEDPIQRGHQIMAASLDEMAEERLEYVEDLHDPSMGWSIPFWIPSRILFEDLVVARVIESWERYLELGRVPLESWPPETATIAWGESGWPPWFAMVGNFTPNLVGVWARAQGASAELQQLRLALDLRLRAPEGVPRDVCRFADPALPALLTGRPVRCRFDQTRNTIVLDLPGAAEALARYLPDHTQAATFPVIELPVADTGPDCPTP